MKEPFLKSFLPFDKLRVNGREIMIDFQLIQESLPLLLRGAAVTLQIAGLSTAIGIVLGTLLGVAQTSKSPLWRSLVTLYVTIIRGIPMLIQITFAYYVLPQLGLSLPAFWVAVVAIGLNSAAYVSQIIKSGIKSIGRGQMEAGKVLGLSPLQITRYVILPQAFRVVIPALGNEFITLVKDSSLAFAAVAIIYLIITTTLSLVINWFEKKVNTHAQH